jgi:hypothetical protein
MITKKQKFEIIRTERNRIEKDFREIVRSVKPIQQTDKTRDDKIVDAIVELAINIINK